MKMRELEKVVGSIRPTMSESSESVEELRDEDSRRCAVGVAVATLGSAMVVGAAMQGDGWGCAVGVMQVRGSGCGWGNVDDAEAGGAWGALYRRRGRAGVDCC